MAHDFGFLFASSSVRYDEDELQGVKDEEWVRIVDVNDQLIIC